MKGHTVCFYCGCREIPLLRDFIAEHERVTDLGALLGEALRSGDVAEARRLVARIALELRVHWRGEEEGLFAQMRSDEAYRGYIEDLEDEHRELRDLLASADPAVEADRARILEAVDSLHAHIAKEEDGLFPASLTALSGDQWDRAISAWQAAQDAFSPRS